MSGIAHHHTEWLSLIEVSGPFLTLPVLDRAFPQGLPKIERKKLGRLRAAFEEWANAQDANTPDAPSLHATWVQLILGELLEFDEETLRSGNSLPSSLEISLPEHQETLRPSMAIVEPVGRVKTGTARLLLAVWPSSQDLESAASTVRWAASPLERMTQLCRSTGVRLGLVTNGERWTLVDAPVGKTAGFASWYAGLWLQEPITLAAFEALLGVRRFFAVAETETLEALLDDSVAFQQEVTDQLGYQVRRAVEVLVQALDRADLDRKRELLREVPPGRLYDAALTVMMRLVFLFCAEERGLLLLGDETYDANYAISTLRAHLREEADRVGVEVLERRQDSWARLLATFRAVHGGIEHEALRIPALGGSLFDPDRYPFLEGRAKDTSWLDTPASPLPIDNRTVLHLLEALQLLRVRGDGGTSEARKLSYRALDIEQIGHVYEGLLDHAAVRVDTDTLGLSGTKDKEPELSLEDLDHERRRGKDLLINFLKEHTGRSTSALRNDLDALPDEEDEQRLLVACGNDRALVKEIAPYHALLRNDVWGYPQIYRIGSFMVTGGSERRQTGTHYTPKSLTEQIVTETLEPLVYIGPADGTPRDAWNLRSAVELLDLKICDMAMGSGAFLVQVCRWLAERVVEAWEEAEREGATISADGQVLEKAAGHDLLPTDREERLNLGRRLVAERCIYGVDINPMAVELAKLSLWLVTLAKGRPFGFLDHNLRSGDSLLGITSLAQLENFHLDPIRGKSLHHTLFDPRREIQQAVAKALDLRHRLRGVRILDVEDVQFMTRLDAESKGVLHRAELIADLLIGAVIAAGGQRALDDRLVELSAAMRHPLVQGVEARQLKNRARELLDTDCSERLRPRRPFHWAVEFPEVFVRERPGFDAIVGNPPFLGGKRISTVLGTVYNTFLAALHPPASKNTDLVAHFFRRAFDLIRSLGNFGLLGVNTIAEGDTRQGGLEWIVQNGGSIYAAHSNEIWPGSAAVITSRVHVHRGTWAGSVRLNGQRARVISAFLSEGEEWTPRRLKANEGISFQGSIVLGMGFTLAEPEAAGMIATDERNRRVLLPYVNGQDICIDPNQRPSRWVINFWDWGETKAKSFRDPYNWIRQRVYPERLEKSRQLSYQNIMSMWWRHWNVRPALYHALGRGDEFENRLRDRQYPTKPLPFALVCVRVSKHLMFDWIPNDRLFTLDLIVFAFQEPADFAILQSSVHSVWAWQHGSKMKHDLRYTPSDVFETFPLPLKKSAALGELGDRYWRLRKQLMNRAGIGLTALYNAFHDPDSNCPSISDLRVLHAAIDQEVVKCYTWQDLRLAHDFLNVPYRPENDQRRFSISEQARIELLCRLGQLNRERYQEGLHEGAQDANGDTLADLRTERRGRASREQTTARESADAYSQGSLILDPLPKAAEPSATYEVGVRGARRIGEWLKAHHGWHGRDEILAGARVDPVDWPPAIKELLEGGVVAKQGERRGTKYRAKQP